MSYVVCRLGEEVEGFWVRVLICHGERGGCRTVCSREGDHVYPEVIAEFRGARKGGGSREDRKPRWLEPFQIVSYEVNRLEIVSA